MIKVAVNGRFLTQKITGVQRYALEIIKELDELVGPQQIMIAVPKNAAEIPELKHISVVSVGSHGGQLWEQIEFPVFAKMNKLMPLNLCNSSPLLFPGLVCIHDVKIKAKPQFFSKKFLLWYRLLFAVTTRNSKGLITVSEFSKNELIHYYHLPPEKIHVIPSAWSHYKNVAFDDGALEKYGLESGRYYFTISSIEPNKNLKWISEAAKNDPAAVFAVAGAVDKHVFADEVCAIPLPNLRLLGYISDAEAKTLMKNCKAFLFPTFYEGFGLPPMEAMSVGAKAVVSDTSCMREIYGDSVYYVDPNDPNVDLDKLLEKGSAGSEEVLDKYNWKKSAEKLKRVLDAYS